MTDFVGEAVSQRFSGDQPSRFRSIGAAVVVGFGAAVLAYKLLRGGSDDGDADDAD